MANFFLTILGTNLDAITDSLDVEADTSDLDQFVVRDQGGSQRYSYECQGCTSGGCPPNKNRPVGTSMLMSNQAIGVANMINGDPIKALTMRFQSEADRQGWIDDHLASLEGCVWAKSEFA